MEIKVIGRSKECDIIIDDTYVSEYHAQIVKDGKQLKVVDLDSKNGTFVNGERIVSEYELKAQDKIRVGNTDVEWQQYFSDKSPHKKSILLVVLMIACFLLLIGIVVLAVSFKKNLCENDNLLKQKLEYEELVEAYADCLESVDKLKSMKNQSISSLQDSSYRQMLENNEKIRELNEKRNSIRILQDSSNRQRSEINSKIGELTETKSRLSLSDSLLNAERTKCATLESRKKYLDSVLKSKDEQLRKLQDKYDTLNDKYNKLQKEPRRTKGQTQNTENNKSAKPNVGSE